MLSDNDIQGTEIDEKHIHVFPPKELAKKKRNFYACVLVRDIHYN